MGTLLLGYLFAVAVASYCALSLAYSLVLKRKPLVDVFILTSFYGFRIVTGALVSRTPLSEWFLIFSMFFFFSLALAKRYSELMHAKELVSSGNSGRGYRAEDSPLILTSGVASSFAAIIVFSFYARSPEVQSLYPHPSPLLLICPLLLYWLVRVWLQAGRGQLKEDPVTLAMRDPMSYKVGFACVLCILLTFLWR
jgi:4-hydroxybenzoate polyprenyltransferase